MTYHLMCVSRSRKDISLRVCTSTDFLVSLCGVLPFFVSTQLRTILVVFVSAKAERKGHCRCRENILVDNFLIDVVLVPLFHSHLQLSTL